ncbi:hypothetical protein M5D96_004201 [Drosophila gunungcola]|uniref:Uncharacterized protein n=1 Tax=Drosophila gunungcola TaxID=103775 RepID=A0A9P9YU79_9MUSC|nr:hypothetical protein M5D96_004201 [Drosophila gunungcola]
MRTVVISKIAGTGKTLFAVVTLVRFVPRVQPGVSIQIRCGQEGLLALGTPVRVVLAPLYLYDRAWNVTIYHR